MTAEEIIAIIYPDFAASASVSDYVTLASMQVSSEFFGEQTELALALFASHNYYLDVVRRGQTGVETYKMEGRLALSTGGVGVLREDLELSSFGLRYKALRQSRMAGVSVSDSLMLTTFTGWQ